MLPMNEYCKMKPKLFVEVRSPSNQEEDNNHLYPDTIEVYIATVEPKQCKTLLKELGSFLPLMKVEEIKKLMKCEHENHCNSYGDNYNHVVVPPLGHLRRVKRCQVSRQEQEVIINTNTEEDGSEAQVKPSTSSKRKQNNNNNNNNNNHQNQNQGGIQLEVLIGSITQIDNLLRHQSTATMNTEQSKGKKLQNIINTYNLKLSKCVLPGRPAKSQKELMEWNDNNWWPTLYFDKQSDEYKEKELELDISEEYGIMSKGMMGAIYDAKRHIEDEVRVRGGSVGVGLAVDTSQSSLSCCHREDQFLYGAVIVCPISEEIVSTSYDEMNTIIKDNSNGSHPHSPEDIKQLLWENPLNSPVLFAIQGVSRKERLAATKLGMDNDSFKKNQVSLDYIL
jgi:hypothetical protein